MTIAVVEILDRDGQARRTVPVSAWPVTIGRAVDCDVVLDDPHVAPLHATVSEGDSGLSLQVGETVNGVQWTGTRLTTGGTGRLPAGEVFHVGATRLRVRRAADALAPERALFPEPSPGRLPLPLLILALFAWNIGAQWLANDPGGRLTDYLTPVLGTALGLIVWCGLWALTSKLFRHRFEFWPHTRIAVRYLLAIQVFGLILPVLAFMVGWPLFSRVAGYVGGAVTCALIVAHLSWIAPARRRVFAVAMGVLFAVGTGLMCTISYQTNDRIFDELYVSTLAPPALRLVPPVAATQFLDEARSLKTVLDAHVKDDDGSGVEGFTRGQGIDAAVRNR